MRDITNRWYVKNNIRSLWFAINESLEREREMKSRRYYLIPDNSELRCAPGIHNLREGKKKRKKEEVDDRLTFPPCINKVGWKPVLNGMVFLDESLRNVLIRGKTCGSPHVCGMYTCTFLSERIFLFFFFLMKDWCTNYWIIIKWRLLLNFVHIDRYVFNDIKLNDFFIIQVC